MNQNFYPCVITRNTCAFDGAAPNLHEALQAFKEYHLAVAQLGMTQFQLELLPIQFHIILEIAERFSALGMSLYSTCLYFALNIEFIHGYLAILIVCHTISYAPSSYITLFSLAFKYQHQFGVL